ncbi:MAG TPA: TauD/TfdA family dioxygenase [Stellaceae bacterium]|nr:TauD/TfdA family dioxygenase [Stellaceae bacterium]
MNDAVFAAMTAPSIGPRLSPAGGVAITGIDLSRPLSPDLRETVMAAFLAHHILVFRGQDLSKEAQLAFTRQFGEIEEHVGRHAAASRYGLVHTVTNLDEDGKPTTKLTQVGNYHWHTDKSYHAVPSLMTVLHAKELPAEGGDTQFANMAMAYEALPETMKRRLDGLRVVHSWAASRRRAGAPPPSEIEMRERPPVEHPLVRTHPETGIKSLYIGNHASHIPGMSEDDSETLLLDLLEHATQPQFLYTHRWRAGDLVMWDNRCLLHRALANYEMAKHRRVLHRTVVTGTVPF